VAQKTKRVAVTSPLRPRLTCPHCGKAFPPGDILWIAEHPSLVGDELLGSSEQNRFLPTRFDVDGNAIDVKGVTCHEVACPNCHLPIPRALVELEPVFISTLGAPSSGKSYFLAAMIQQAQESALRYFQSNLADVDPIANEVVNDYLNRLFRNSQPGELVALEKTQQTGRQYNSVNLDQRDIYLAKPFVYSLQPLKLQDEKLRRQLCRAVCLYDNAGEHFMPGKTASQMATQHMAHSRALLFLFDPLQHARFRQACFGKAEDPQLGNLGKNNPQDQVLMEAARRVRSLTGLGQHAKFSRPLIVVVTKYDVWHSLLAEGIFDTNALLFRNANGTTALDLKRIAKLSERMRELLFQYAPDIVAAAEGFSEEVIYLPNSALGCSPEVMSGTNALGVRPCNIRPRLAEIPLLYALHRAVPTLIPAIQRTNEKGSEPVVAEPPPPPPPSAKKPGAMLARAMAEQRLASNGTTGQPNASEANGPPATEAPKSIVPDREVPLAEAPSPPTGPVDNYLKEASS
jgi:hypothetical protein